MQKHNQTSYQISTLLPKSISNNIMQKISRKNKDKMILIEDGPKIIYEDSEQNRLSPIVSKNNNFSMNPNKSKYRSSSHDEIIVGPRKIFQNKIKLKKGQDIDYHPYFGSAQKYSDGENGKGQSKDSDQRDTKINFAEQYRINLRRTVFNQTKMMIKSKKSKLKYSYQTIDQSKVNNTLKQIKQTQNIQQKQYLHSQRKKHKSQKLSNIDTMYKTIINNHKINHIKAQCNELQIARFPLIMKTKQDLNLNYSNLLTAMNIRQNALKNTMKQDKLEQKPKFSKRLNRGSSRGSVFEKHEIKPWETFADQFFQ